MKRIFILLVVTLLFAASAFAEEAILIDFSKLNADIVNDQRGNPTQNRQTVMDYGQVAGSSYTPDQKAAMKTSLAITNWDVVFSSSSRTVSNIASTYTREAESKQFGTVLGVRVHFPLENFYSKAEIKPPFEIPAFEPQADIDDNGQIQPTDSNGITGVSRFEDGYGVVKNVGTIRSVAVNAYGLQFPHALNVLLIDAQGNEKAVFMGYLNYDGWAELTWNNPQYIMEVRNRELRLYPLYPQSTPFVKFAGFRIDRDADKDGGDFIAYFKDVKIIYDKAVLDQDRDIDDEALWNIIRDRETAKKIWEMERFGQAQILRYLEDEKKAQEVWDPLYGTTIQERYGFTPTPANQ
ncbi:MAG: flagellar filament outer layer protein FlaA [Treponema sp.]|nr:flagellar filament outer layer protein FlaA [Treponema sp.]